LQRLAEAKVMSVDGGTILGLWDRLNAWRKARHCPRIEFLRGQDSTYRRADGVQIGVRVINTGVTPIRISDICPTAKVPKWCAIKPTCAVLGPLSYPHCAGGFPVPRIRDDPLDPYENAERRLPTVLEAKTGVRVFWRARSDITVAARVRAVCVEADGRIVCAKIPDDVLGTLAGTPSL
jgi:hypothetical protein